MFQKSYHKTYRRIRAHLGGAPESSSETSLWEYVPPLGIRSPFGVANEHELITCTLFDHSDHKGFSPPLTTLLSRTPFFFSTLFGGVELSSKGDPPMGLQPPLSIAPSLLAYLVEKKWP